MIHLFRFYPHHIFHRYLQPFVDDQPKLTSLLKRNQKILEHKFEKLIVPNPNYFTPYTTVQCTDVHVKSRVDSILRNFFIFCHLAISRTHVVKVQ